MSDPTLEDQMERSRKEQREQCPDAERVPFFDEVSGMMFMVRQDTEEKTDKESVPIQ